MSATEGPAVSGVAPELVAVPARSSAEQLRLLLRLSETLARTKTVDEVAASIVDIAQHYLGAMFGGLAVLQPDGEQMQYVRLETLPEDVQRSRRSFPFASSWPAATVARQHRPLFLSSLAAAVEAFDEESGLAARQTGGQSFAYLPMLVDRKAVGTVVLIWADEVRFTQDDQRLLWALARYSAQAIERARLLADRHDVARTLQEALLPILPEISWLQMSGHYRPANLAEAVGGDWYDAFISDPGDEAYPETLTVAVGDVTGHDMQAAAEMGRLQAKLRALAIDHPDRPHRLLHRLERVMTANIHNRHATALIANLTPTGEGRVAMRWSNAGHPPPLILEPGVPAHYLERPTNLLLGLDRDTVRHSHTIVLPPATTILLYTDGMIERRGAGIDDGMDSLARHADLNRDLPVTALVDSLINELGTVDHHDDTVLFALRLPG